MTKARLLYIAGPMTGLPQFNYPAFHAAAVKLQAAGFEVLNPADNRLEADAKWEDYMRVALGQLLRADGVALLPGWEVSRGARIEYGLARDLNVPARLVRYWQTKGQQDAYMARLQEAGK